MGEAEGNALSVKQELQATASPASGPTTPRSRKGARAVGDDRLQQRGQGHVVPESFTHGTSAQRAKWFNRGLSSGDPNQCDTFAATDLG